MAQQLNKRSVGKRLHDKRIAKRMTKTEAAWLAGLFDGEGMCRNCQAHRQNGNFCLELCIRMTNEEIVQKVEEVTGCGSVRSYAASRAGDKQIFQWAVFGQNAASVLQQIHPWLIVKRQIGLDLILDNYDMLRKWGV